MTTQAVATSDAEFVVIFDPNGGFVTGGGWINSPAGASARLPDRDRQGELRVRLEVQEGSNVPEGETEFQFKAGDLNFHSSAYDESLVISGHKAQYRGTGTINGVPGYRFLLTAYDGQVARRRGSGQVPHEDHDGRLVVYDNRMGVSEDLDLADPMAIAGGSIVIHKK